MFKQRILKVIVFGAFGAILISNATGILAAGPVKRSTLQPFQPPASVPGKSSRFIKIQPDLQPVSCSFIPASPKEGKSFEMVLRVRNSGRKRAIFPSGTKYYQRLLWSGDFGAQVFNVSPVWEPRQTREFKIKINPQARGTKTGRYKVDPRNLITEGNEKNNEIICKVTIERDGWF